MATEGDRARIGGAGDGAVGAADAALVLAAAACPRPDGGLTRDNQDDDFEDWPEAVWTALRTREEPATWSAAQAIGTGNFKPRWRPSSGLAGVLLRSERRSSTDKGCNSDVLK